MSSSFTTPEGVLMLFLAGLLDLIGLLCLIADLAFGIGEIFSFIPDVIGIIFFGSWMLMRLQASGDDVKDMTKQVSDKKQTMETSKKVLKKTAKKASRKGLRFGLASLGELIPLLGALPFWTIFVISELKQDS